MKVFDSITTRVGTCDQASLLIALLRAAGIPVRYVYGTVRIPIDMLGIAVLMLIVAFFVAAPLALALLFAGLLVAGCGLSSIYDSSIPFDAYSDTAGLLLAGILEAAGVVALPAGVAGLLVALFFTFTGAGNWCAEL